MLQFYGIVATVEHAKPFGVALGDFSPSAVDRGAETLVFAADLSVIGKYIVAALKGEIVLELCLLLSSLSFWTLHREVVVLSHPTKPAINIL